MQMASVTKYSTLLDAHVCEIVQWHFSPETGTPFWLDWATRAGWNPADEIKTAADLKAFPHFVDGCFWHGCPKHANMPANIRGFWSKKLGANRARDRFVTYRLRRLGWRVSRICEHQLTRNPLRCISRIEEMLKRPQAV